MSKDTKKNAPKSKGKKKKTQLPAHLEHIHQKAAGIDVGSRSHFVAVPQGCAQNTVQEFKSFTSDLHQLVAWLKSCDIETVAMESTGVYWIPLYELLESSGFDVQLVDARQVKNVSGRKTDVLDCQWIQQLHTYGLLQSAFRPDEHVCALRAYMRQRSELIKQAARHIQHMQKALSLMNLQLHNVIRDITGRTGMAIIRDIVAGNRDPGVLAKHRDPHCKNNLETIEKSLEGNYRQEHVFALTQALELYDTYHEKVKACDEQIEQQMQVFEYRDSEAPQKQSSKSKPKNTLNFDVSLYLRRIVSVDLTAIPGIEAYSALKIVSEIGFDLSRFKSAKQFASWLGLCPGNKVSGGKVLSGKSKRTSNYASAAFRMAASSLHRSQTALGAFLRRLKARLGSPKAVTATAHKLAIIVYNMLTKGEDYVDVGLDYYEQRYQERVLKNLNQRAKKLGYELVQTSENSMT